MISSANNKGGENREGTFICIYCHKEHPVELTRCLETGNQLSPVHKLLSTILEGKYRITRFIGEGGMGVLYEAEHLTIGKKLAIKFLNPQLCTSEESFERFKREAKAAAAIAHKNIVSIVDIGTTPHAIPYTIMEFLTGEDLAGRMEKQGTASFGDAVSILSQVLEALSAVHSCGVVHRDLKPENIFIARQSGGDEIIKILDFGVSRLTETETPTSRITKSGFVYGTPFYIAPEQAEGRTTVDHRADLYSVGTIFYEMITGTLPFPTKAYGKLLVEIITRPPPDPSVYIPTISRAVKEFIATSLAKDPNERFQSAEEMLRELRSLDSLTERDRKAPAETLRPARRTPAPRHAPAVPLPGTGPRKPSSGAYRMLAGTVEKISAPGKKASRSPSLPPLKRPMAPPAPLTPKTAQAAAASPKTPRPVSGPTPSYPAKQPSSPAVRQEGRIEHDRNTEESNEEEERDVER